ncbi:MAG: protein translocase subunit SecD [Desulfatibacillaceae bacterium]
MRDFTWRVTLVGAVLLAAIILLLPTVKFYFFEEPGTRDQDELMWPDRLINLGLDLQGGMHLALEVQTEEAVASTMNRYENDLREMARRDKDIRYSDLELVDGTGLKITLKGQQSRQAFDTMLGENFPELATESGKAANGDVTLLLTLPGEERERIKRSAVDQALETIRNRIDQYGVSEPEIRKQGDRRVLVQLPGVNEPQRVKELLKGTAQLQFRLLDESTDPSKVRKGMEPRGSELLYEVYRDPATGQTRRIPYLVKKKVLLTGDYLKDARVQMGGQFNQPEVDIEFDKEGARIFEQITGAHVGDRLAIVLDNTVYSAPTIQDRISGGSARITGSFDMDSASDLAIVLRAGALPASVNIIEERTVGASLGAESIRKGTISMLFGLVLVIVFIAVYYKGAGLVADMALVLNIVLLSAGLALFNATLTLPGIAGIILTIGMAVDANVLIFERIREEMRLGKTPSAAVDSGYARATLTIIDANVTTLVAALVLFQFGTGPVKGFAVTLSLGILSSLFTAIIVSRVVFDYFLFYRRVRSLSI